MHNTFKCSQGFCFSIFTVKFKTSCWRSCIGLILMLSRIAPGVWGGGGGDFLLFIPFNPGSHTIFLGCCLVYSVVTQADHPLFVWCVNCWNLRLDFEATRSVEILFD